MSRVKKGVQFKVWLTEDEYKTLMAEAEYYNISAAELVKVWIHKTYSAKTMLYPYDPDATEYLPDK